MVRSMVDEGIGFWGYFFDSNNIFLILLDIFFIPIIFLILNPFNVQVSSKNGKNRGRRSKFIE